MTGRAAMVNLARLHSQTTARPYALKTAHFVAEGLLALTLLPLGYAVAQTRARRPSATSDIYIFILRYADKA